MPTPSNLYAEKVFAEHPLALWALDDEIIYSNKIDLYSAGIAIPDNFNGIKASSYGFQDTPGYYITNDANAVYAKNTGIPMVYGASNTTVLREHLDAGINYPALIIPGNGFLNESGKYKTLTFEMWIRINTGNPEAFRFFGPISSTDGLYVDRSFITMKIGNNVKSHFISEWSRPMLIQFSVSENLASLTINGEQVFSIQYDTSLLSLPSKYDSSGKDQDWLGLYANSEISPLEIDCVGIYPYIVPDVVAKRRFVYGQAVDFPETTNNSYNGSSFFVDYKFANYAKNYSYPDLGKWQQGIFENVSIDNNILSSPDYSLPDIILSTGTSNDLLSDISTIQNSQDTFITLKPNSEWSDIDGYIYFNSLNLLKEDTKAVYGVFSVSTVTTKETLFKIKDDANGNYLAATIDSDLNVEYVFSYNSSEEVLLSTAVQENTKFFAGFNITNLINSFGKNMFAFFGAKSKLSVYLGGNKDFSETFAGKIYSFSFANQTLLSHIGSAFQQNGLLNPVIVPNVFDQYGETVDIDGGTPDTTVWASELDGGSVTNIEELIVEDILSDYSSYTLFLKEYLGTYYLDIKSKSIWQDYVPLSYLAKSVDSDGQNVIDLDFIQFNIKYPETKNIVDGYLNTNNSVARTYVSFQQLSSGANKSLDNFDAVVPLNTNKTVTPTPTNFDTYLYEVVNGTIVYLPSGITLKDVAICVHIEMKVDGTISNGINIKSLELASQAFNYQTETQIGTRFGVPAIPYTVIDNQQDYKAKNPFVIYKGSTPYLYLTANTGIKVLGNQAGATRGLEVPVNKSAIDNYLINVLQISARYDEKEFSATKTKLVDIVDKDKSLTLYVTRDGVDSNLGNLTIENSFTGVVLGDEEVVFYINGVLDNQLEKDEWSMIGIQFKTKLNFSNFTGKIFLTGPLLINFISQERLVSLAQTNEYVFKDWQNAFDTYMTWDNMDTETTWGEILFTIEASSYNIDPRDVYLNYIGTNKIVVEDDKTLTLNNYEYTSFTDTSWQTSIVSAT